MNYIHTSSTWPAFQWNRPQLADQLAAVHRGHGRLLGQLESLGFDLQQEALLRTFTQDALKTSEIEGERLDAGEVRSSVARHLGIDIGGLTPADRATEGVVEMVLDATRNYHQPLTVERLHGWQTLLFPTGRSGLQKISVGAWRDDSGGPMQVVSGPYGRERVHFEAPAAVRLLQEMETFLEWFNGVNETDWVAKAGVAHLWFVTLHPFADGNGRIARAITDMALARSEQSPQRFYSMSAQIQKERGRYYETLEQTQKATTDISAWMAWFFACLDRAIQGAQLTLADVLGRATFWKSFSGPAPNERQRQMLNLLITGYGKLTTAKWAKLTKSSHDTALRDIAALVSRGTLKRSAASGRSTSYELAQP